MTKKTGVGEQNKKKNKKKKTNNKQKPTNQPNKQTNKQTNNNQKQSIQNRTTFIGFGWTTTKINLSVIYKA